MILSRVEGIIGWTGHSKWKSFHRNLRKRLSVAMSFPYESIRSTRNFIKSTITIAIWFKVCSMPSFYRFSREKKQKIVEPDERCRYSKNIISLRIKGKIFCRSIRFHLTRFDQMEFYQINFYFLTVNRWVFFSVTIMV